MKSPGSPVLDPPDRPALAVGLMLSALFLLALQDSIVRLVGGSTSLWQFQFLRSGLNLLLLLGIARVLWGTLPRWPGNIRAVAARSVLLVGAMVGFFGGVPELTLTQMAAGLYTFPLFVTLLSAVFLGEGVGPRRAAAVAVGATGAALILQPWAEGFRWLQMLPVGAGLCYAAMILVTRRHCRAESPVTLAFGVSLAYLAATVVGLGAIAVIRPGAAAQAAAPYLATGWPELTETVLAAVVVCSVLNLACNISLSKAYQSAESSWLAPFDYSYLIFATVWGFVVFADLPDTSTLAGMLLIASAGVFTAWREQRLARQGRK